MFIVMFRSIFFILVSLFLLCNTHDTMAQSPTDSPDYRALSAQQKEFKAREDSMSSALAVARKLYEDGQTSASDQIVRLEGEIYDLRAKISRLTTRMTAIEQQFATESLADKPKEKGEKRGFFANDIFTSSFARKELAYLSSAAAVEGKATEMNNLATALYAQLKSLKVTYEATSSQAELDSTRASAQTIKKHITKINSDLMSRWDKLYNFKLDSYLVLVDKLENIDRSTIEALESQGREVRRAEAFTEDLLNPNFVIFETQRAYIHAYEKAIASAAKLTNALDSIAHIDVILTDVDSMKNIDFDPRILTIYAPVSFQKENYPIKNVQDVPEAILPEKGIYYSIQIALMSNEARSLDMFKGAMPLQVEHTKDGKFRYMVGGFNSYANAAKAVQVLVREGYRAPVMVAWIDGAFTSTSRAKTAEASRPKVETATGNFKIEVTTTDQTVGEKLRSLVEMHAKDKSVARVVKGKELIFTITEFSDRYEAEVLAQIVRERTGASADVVAIKSQQPEDVTQK